ncbi:hypothetical protein ACLB2K_016350 [Fragaria x ananassa]
MATSLRSTLFLVTMFCRLFEEYYCFAYNYNHFNSSSQRSRIATNWYYAGATWYGGPDGFGSDGGSCGYRDIVSRPPFSSMVTAVGPSLYQSGKECGACFLVKCTRHKFCSGKLVRVVITDSCPGCVSDSAHFDLSGTAFGAMALPGQAQNLRNAGVLQIKFARVPCNYLGKTIEFYVDQGSNPYYFAVLVQYEEGDGDLGYVELKDSSKKGWRAMQRSWGAVWKLDAGSKLQPPLSIRMISRHSGHALVAKNVIPNGWQPGATYRSLVNYL